MAKNQKKKAEEAVSPGDEQAAAADQQMVSPDVGQQSEQATGEQADQAGDTVANGPVQLRYVGKTIKHFDHQGKIYQLIPNTVYLNLPSDAEQVKRLIDYKELIGV